MPVEIDGIRYLTVPEVLQEMQITRQTLWRWRQERLIPQGRRFRSRQLLFSQEEAAAIRRYANRIEPIEAPGSDQQMNLFGSSAERSSNS